MNFYSKKIKYIFLVLNLLIFIANIYLLRIPKKKQKHLVRVPLWRGACFEESHTASPELAEEWIVIAETNISLLHANDQTASDATSNKNKNFKFENEGHDGQWSKHTVPLIEKTTAVDCELVLQGDEDEIVKGERWMKENPKVPLSEEHYLQATQDCGGFKDSRGYVQRPLTPEEASFPLAFSIASFRDVEQTERLLRAIYQPQNLYCIHVDSKSPILFYRTLRSIARCFSNVWVSSRLGKVKWGDVSVIMAEMNCLHDLLNHFRGRYKYFINLTGQEFPLRSNLELVQISKLFNGSNDISGSHLRMEMDRVQYRWSHTWSEQYQQTVLYNTHMSKPPYPYANVTFFKGETHGLFSAKMTEFLIESFHGKMFFKWCFDTGHASEHYWNTLNYNPHLGAPGAYVGDLKLADHYSLHPVVRAKNWVNLYRDQWPCYGKVVRGLCVFSLRDLSWLRSRPELFVNKFHLTYQSLAYDCIEELQRNKTRLNTPASLSYYQNLPTVLHSKKDGL